MFDSASFDARLLDQIVEVEFTRVQDNRLFIGLRLSAAPTERWLQRVKNLICDATQLPGSKAHHGDIETSLNYPDAGPEFIILRTGPLSPACSDQPQSRGFQVVLRNNNGAGKALVNRHRFERDQTNN